MEWNLAAKSPGALTPGPLILRNFCRTHPPFIPGTASSTSTVRPGQAAPTTISFPLFSGFLASSMAAQAAAGANAAHQAFLFRQLPRHFCCIFILHLHHVVDDVDIQHIRNETGAKTLDGVPPWLQWLAGATLGDDRAVDGFYRDHFHAGFSLFQDLTYAGDRAAGADAANDNVNLAIGVFPNFFRSRLAVNFRIRRILELLRHKIILVLRGNSSALRMAPGMPSAAGVSTSSAPRALSIRRRSKLMLSGSVTTNLYPRAAQT